MPAQRDSRIIVLHLTKYGDSSLVVHALDAERGRTGFFLRGAGKGRVALNHFQSLSILDIQTVSGKGELEYIREYESAHQLAGIKTNPYKSAIAMFMGELLYRCTGDGAVDAEMFSFLESEILRLEHEEGSIANYHLCFMVRLCGMMGFRPKDNWSPDTPLFLPAAAEFIPYSDYISTFSAEESLLLHRILSLPVEEAMQLPLNREQRQSFAQKMAEYLSCHLSINLKLKSLAVLHDIF